MTDYAIQTLKERYPGRTPIILDDPDHLLTKTKFMVPEEITVGQFMNAVRQRATVDAHRALFLFVNRSTMPRVSDAIYEVYDRWHDDDGCLRMTLKAEHTFGGATS